MITSDFVHAEPITRPKKCYECGVTDDRPSLHVFKYEGFWHTRCFICGYEIRKINATQGILFMEWPDDDLLAWLSVNPNYRNVAHPEASGETA
jgi:hypothetical protein